MLLGWLILNLNVEPKQLAAPLSTNARDFPVLTRKH
jgi:hypothetical protein